MRTRKTPRVGCCPIAANRDKRYSGRSKLISPVVLIFSVIDHRLSTFDGDCESSPTSRLVFRCSCYEYHAFPLDAICTAGRTVLTCV